MDVVVQCEVNPGIFSDESVVTVRDVVGRELSYSVPQASVSDKGVCAKVLSKTDDHIWVSLPTNYRDSIAVSRDRIAVDAAPVAR